MKDHPYTTKTSDQISHHQIAEEEIVDHLCHPVIACRKTDHYSTIPWI
jgi:hypothetical protein